MECKAIQAERALREDLTVTINQMGRLKLRIFIWETIMLGHLHLEEIHPSNNRVSVKRYNWEPERKEKKGMDKNVANNFSLNELFYSR